MNVKTTILTFFFLLLNVFLFAQQRSMGSQGILGKIQKVIDATEELDMEVVRVEADLIRTTKENTRTLDPSFKYLITAVGSNRIEDIDIEVYKLVNNSWMLITKDTDTKSVAVVEVSPSSYAEYKFVVKVYKFYEGYEIGHYGLIISHN